MIIATATISGHEARGRASIRSLPSGEMILQMDDYWIAPGAPDVHVYLTPERNGEVAGAGVVDFGRITKLSGSIQYPIPPDTDIQQIQKVVVYCKVYSVLFGDGPFLRES